MFDYEHHRNMQTAAQTGRNPDNALLTTFRYEFDDRSGKEIEYINIWLSKNACVDRPATDDDRQRFADRYEAFLKKEEVPPEGLPIKQIPFATPANISACKEMRIFTAEQLVETADGVLARSSLQGFKAQVSDMLKQLKDSKHVIEMREELDELKSQLAAVLEQNAELKSQITEEPTPKKRGPRKKSDGNDQGDS